MNVLLIEPNYKNKYPPMGLMKIAFYHRQLGDQVTFFKGDLNDFVIRTITEQLIEKLSGIDKDRNWAKDYTIIYNYIKTGKSNYIDDLELGDDLLLLNGIKYYRNQFKNKTFFQQNKWDRVYITTLFTFYWKITIDTINFAKQFVYDIKQVHVGGILATLLYRELIESVGEVTVHRGLLDKPGILGNDDLIVDELPLDYSILEEVDYHYPETDAYYGYMTRGCVNKCSFCAVPKLEPSFRHYIPLREKIRQTDRLFGAQRNLLLLDNNVLASSQFADIIEEIKACGFTANATFTEPNYLEIAINNLRSGSNEKGYLRKCFFLLHEFLNKLKGDEQQKLYDLLEANGLLSVYTVRRENILTVYEQIKDVYIKYLPKGKKHRYVDFNQGIDARLLTEERMALLAQIPIRPLRIAFDNLKFEKIYVESIRCAVRHGIKYLSNYILYNEKDSPDELYRRLEINIQLCEENPQISIHSFPMKYHPIGKLDGIEWYKNRDYLGEHWNRKFIRTIQVILNATKGKVGKSKSFFYEAFGKNLNEFHDLLYMPEDYVLYRFFFRDIGITEQWRKDFYSLAPEEMVEIKNIVHKNRFTNLEILTQNERILTILKNHYIDSHIDINNPTSKYYEMKREYDQKMKTN